MSDYVRDWERRSQNLANNLPLSSALVFLGGNVRKVFFAVLLAFSGVMHAGDGMGIDVSKLKRVSVMEIQGRYPETLDSEFILVDLDINSKTKRLTESYIELGLVDKGSLHSDEFSEFSYDRYIVSFNLVSGDFVKVVKGGWGSYQDVDNSALR